MLTSILGARLNWYQADGWVFDPVTVGPDIIEYTLAKGPHAGRHAIHRHHPSRHRQAVGPRHAGQGDENVEDWRGDRAVRR